MKTESAKRRRGDAEQPRSTFLKRLEVRLARLPKCGAGVKGAKTQSEGARAAPDRLAGKSRGSKAERTLLKTKVLVVDEHPMVREWMASFLKRQGDLEMCGEATTAEAALERIETLRPHLVIMELTIGKDFGIELIKDIKARWSSLPVLALSASDETIYAERALRSGALGYVSKAAEPSEIARAIRCVLTGRVYVSDAIACLLLGRFARSPIALPHTEIEWLSDREMEVFELIGAGRSSREIGAQLHIGIKTVDSYKTRLKEKLDLQNARELLQYSVRWLLTKSASSASPLG